MRLTTDEDIRQLLQESQHVAVVGWSPKPDRPSHEVAAYLKRAATPSIPSIRRARHA